ncbi:MAG: RNA methyltransferase [Opitutales bacterium]|nr:RNA methyltransferase [Opitutales bacterium]
MVTATPPHLDYRHRSGAQTDLRKANLRKQVEDLARKAVIPKKIQLRLRLAMDARHGRMAVMFESITSVRNPRVKHLVRLRDSSHRKRQGRFPVEGRREVERALKTGWPLETLYFCPDFFPRVDAYSVVEAADAASVDCVLMDKVPFAKASLRENPDGILAVAHTRTLSLDDLPAGEPPLLLVAQGIEKPGNLGALLRTADATGADALVACDPVADLYNPNAVRASQGSFFHVPAAATSTEVLLDWLADKGIQPVMTTPGAERTLWEADLTGAVAVVVGAEASGLPSAWLAAPGTSVRLPMRGLADSLNVNTAAAVCLYEAMRQRSSAR